MNNIRITNIRMDADQAEIIADLTAAYEPEVGVKKFKRTFKFTAPGSFVVTDSIETEKPQTITSYLHADSRITRDSDRIFILEPGATQLKVEFTEPDSLDAKSEINVLTAPGRPGSVDKGEREERGVRLAISTKNKVDKLNLVVKMQIERRK
jgi:hypothetical protein